MRWYPFALLLLSIISSDAIADDRDSSLFLQWRASHPEIALFESYLKQETIDSEVPIHELLRTASDWKKCEQPAFEVPPKQQWPAVKSVLLLVRELRSKQVLSTFEIRSGYRNEKLNKCAKGAKRSAHLKSFALDISSNEGARVTQRLCDFWRKHGGKWRMGLSRYPSGRIHIDTHGYRTWSAEKQPSVCQGAA